MQLNKKIKIKSLLKLLTFQDNMLTHHRDDDHIQTITGLSQSVKLNCFVSCSIDGYVKVWDSENRYNKFYA